MNWTQRIAAASGATILSLTLLGAAASADPAAPPSSPPAFDVKRVCDQRIPKIEERATKLVTRITGDANVTGSSANLRARAERAKNAGNDAQADWLNGRAQHRDDRVAVVRKALDQLNSYKQKYCGK
jgi:hypothetical protein